MSDEEDKGRLQEQAAPSATGRDDPRMPPAAWFLDQNDNSAAVATAHWAKRFAAAILAATGISETPLPMKAAAPNLLLQSVIIRGAQTTEGSLIEAVTLPWFDIIAVINKDPTIVFEISAEKWEEIIAGAYKRAGWDEVTLTPRSGDHGRDVIAVKKGVGHVRVIDQVKAYKKGNLVTYDDVRALLGVLQGDGASKGFLTTTSDFPPNIMKDPLIVPFIPSRLELVNGTMLRANLEELYRQNNK